MAAIGQFQGPQTPYGVPPNTVHPQDNDITPDPTLAEADRQKAAADDLYDQLQNAQRTQTTK